MLDDLAGAAPVLISNTMLPTTLGSAGLLPPPDTGTAGAVGAVGAMGAVGALGSAGLLPPPGTGTTGAAGAAAVVVGGAASLQASSAAATATMVNTLVVRGVALLSAAA